MKFVNRYKELTLQNKHDIITSKSKVEIDFVKTTNCNKNENYFAKLTQINSGGYDKSVRLQVSRPNAYLSNVKGV